MEDLFDRGPGPQEIQTLDLGFWVEATGEGMIFFSASNVAGEAAGRLDLGEIDRLIALLIRERDKYEREASDDG